MTSHFLPEPSPDASLPDAKGRFGEFGGRFVPETLIAALDQLETEYYQSRKDPAFQAELDVLLRDFVGRPSPLYFAKRLTEHCGGAQIWFKREDLNHTGAHKINSTLGQALLTIRMGKKRVIAETGAGQHGVATATACAHFGIPCIIYMGEEDIRRQQPNVQSMKMLGAEICPVTTGSRTLRDAVNQAMRDWMSSVAETHYILGSVVGPHPFPLIVRDYQAVIGRETITQSQERFGRLPDAVVACVGGGSNAAGMFYPFVAETNVPLVGVEAGGESDQPGRHASSLTFGKPGVLHGSFSMFYKTKMGRRTTSTLLRPDWIIRVLVPSIATGNRPAALSIAVAEMMKLSLLSIWLPVTKGFFRHSKLLMRLPKEWKSLKSVEKMRWSLSAFQDAAIKTPVRSSV